MMYKTIFKGWLEFGSKKSFDKVINMLEHRVENYYKNEILLDIDEIFDEENVALYIPKVISQGNKKYWKNTMSLLKYIAQFAVTGKVLAWMTDDGKVLHHNIIEPTSEKVAVQEYIKGRRLIRKGKEKEAIEALNRAINKYEAHAMAYERRGHINVQLGNLEDALRDYDKSIRFNSKNPESLLGRALVLIKKNEYERAAEDLKEAIQCSIPLESIYWIARRLKSECFLKLDNPEEALLDLKLFASRSFDEDDPNYAVQRTVTFSYAKALFELDRFEEAIAQFQKALDMPPEQGNIDDAEILFFKGLALQKAGKGGFMDDFEKAHAQGFEEAGKYLEKQS